MKHNRLTALTGLILAASCGGGLGPGCGGCSPSNYTYPSKVMQGTEMVDDAVRARLTERGLDFLGAHFKDILRQAFPPDVTNPNVSRIALPSQSFVDTMNGTVDGRICLQGNTASPPGGCVVPAAANKVSAILLDLNDLENKLVMDFITTPEPGIRITANSINLGFEGRIRTTVELGGVSLLTTDADCDVLGQTTAAGAPTGTMAQMDLTVEIYPRVSTNPAECAAGVAQCFFASVNVMNAAIRDVGLGAQSPPKCTSGLVNGSDPLLCGAGGCLPAGCSPGCSDGPLGFNCSPSDACFSNLLCMDNKGDCECTDLLCPVFSFGATLIGQIGDFLFTILEPFLDTILTSALTNALAQFNGQPLALTSQVDVGAFAGNLVPGVAGANALGFSLAPTNSAFQVTCPTGTASCDVRRGMDFYMKAGFEAVNDVAAGKPAPSECVPLIQGAKFLSLYNAVTFEAADGAPLSGEFLDATTNMPKVYDLAASLSRASLNQLGYAIFNGGVLCLSLDSAAIHGLTKGGFSFTAGALDLLTSGHLSQYVDPKAPVFITLAPEEPPVFTLGTGTMMDPHLQLSMKKMHVSIYVYMYERYARLFEVVADVGAGLNITRDDMTHELHIAVASGPTINNFTQTYNELMPGVDFGDVLPSLIDVALGALLNQEISFNFDVAPLLSNALGGAPVFVVFEALQTERVNNRGEFINLYLSLSSTNPNPLTLTADPNIQAAQDVRTWYRDVNGEPQASGFARLTGVLRPLPQDQRYSTQVDFGPWSEWMAPDDEGVLYVMSSKLKLTGQHSIRVRAMKANQPATVSAEERTVMVWTDPAAPRVWLNRMEGRVAVRAEDRVADSQLLRMRFKVDGAEFGEWETVRDVTASELAGDVLTVEVRDPAGNVAQERVLLRDSSAVAAGKNVAGASSSSGCACAVPTGGTTPGMMLLLGVLAIVARRRQR